MCLRIEPIGIDNAYLIAGRRYSNMKKYLLMAICLLCAGAVSVPVGAAVTLDSTWLIGTVVNSTPSNPSDEVSYSNQLISMYNSDPNITGPILVGTETFTLAIGANVAPEDLALVVLGGYDKIDPPIIPYVTLPFAYDYLYAKFGGFGALFWLGGETTIEGISLAPPVGVEGGGLSHYTFFNPTRVPEPGTLLLLGSGLIGLVVFGRKFRR